jgi:beta-1,4-mannosyl-glycoprotein beta-1,4-N-acetylglucosaminyltransferase
MSIVGQEFSPTYMLSITALLICFLASTSSQKIIDVITFNGDVFADIRLQYLRDVVDLFVVVESRYTFSGQYKDEFYLDVHSDWFSALLEERKLLPLKIENETMSRGITFEMVTKDTIQTTHHAAALIREGFQRDYALQAVMDLMGEESFILLSSDADELPTKEIVQTLPGRYEELIDGAVLDMVYFYYNFKWVKPHSRWQRAILVTDKLLKKTEADIGFLSLQYLRMTGKFIVLGNAGWHCSHCLSSDKIVHKLRAYSHAHEDPSHNESQFLNIEWIEDCISKGEDIFHRHEKLVPYDGKKGIPDLSTISGYDYLLRT